VDRLQAVHFGATAADDARPLGPAGAFDLVGESRQGRQLGEILFAGLAIDRGEEVGG
jgi:hypothetical protein